MYPEHRLEIVFQPHLFSRTRDFADGFAESLALADGVYLLPIYAAREEPMPGVSSAMLAERMDGIDPVLPRDGRELLERLRERKPGVLLMAGAGDISDLVEPVRELMAASDQ